MRLIEYYIRLFIRFAEIKRDSPTSVTRHAISKELACSERNVIHILNKMEAEKWIKVIRGKGRGNTTNITFFKTLEEMFEKHEKYSSKTEDIERLISILEHDTQLNESHQLINTCINQLFGTYSKLSRNVEDESEYLKIPYFRSLYSLDPSQVERQTERHLVKQMFNTLVTYNEEKEEIEPSLSHLWEIDRDGKTFTFYIRKGVSFHHSKRLEAEDVRFTFERLKKTPSNWIVKDLDTIKCFGKYVVQFTFTKSSFHWLLLITSPKCSIVPNNYANKSIDEFSKFPIGTGPYRIKEHESNFLKLSVHHEYFQERAHIDEIDIFILPSIEKYLNINDDINRDSIFYIPFTTMKDNNSELEYIERRRLSVKYLMWNMNREKIRTNEGMRRKLSAILNKTKMVNDLGYPRYEHANSFIKQHSSSQAGKYGHEPYDNIIKEPLTLLTYDLSPHREDVKWIQKECNKHGIKIETKQLPFSAFIDNVKDADLVLSEFVTEESEEISLYNLVESQTGVIYNLIDQENKAIIQRNLDNVFQKEEMQNRIEELKKVDTLLCESCITIPLYWTFQKALYDKNLLGVSLSTIGLVPFKDLFYRKQLGSYHK
ncbi:ABC transporter substrate-binding protein [Gracilibacillus caseinilyticus]|uniref:ABC transporter substrate-binding protein n=1 Tax=Gracilibacillus caseinilyticus TaxID=2932256 RepID=A0ABY4F1N3_9BACI|nr:ABC transporter substrate-binding protein [Gracilibacillus caseinilyticus]UOQ49799.1 ABC transporter substrate-binding protein [Gracilibacillus caseinilyticus]